MPKPVNVTRRPAVNVTVTRGPKPMAEPDSLPPAVKTPEPPPCNQVPTVILLRPSWLDVPLHRVVRRLGAIVGLLVLEAGLIVLALGWCARALGLLP